LEKLESPYLTGIIKPQKFIRWETQRGCPFRCSFCQHREPQKEVSVRRSLEFQRIKKEVEWICEHPEIQDIAVLDPVFNSGPHYIEVLKMLFEGKFLGKLSLQSRLEMVTDEFLNAVSDLNSTGARVVLEFGIQTIHKNEQKIIQRGNNLKKADTVLEQCSKRKILFEISLIFGLPEQTIQSFLETVAWAVSKSAFAVHAFPLMLLRGTDLHENKTQLGLIESNDVDKIDGISLSEHNGRFWNSDIPVVIASKSFAFTEWIEMAKIAEQLDLENSFRKKQQSDFNTDNISK